ncbi:hypothetical protein FQA39_LY08228 [Lamprigera yunnana]|nr:hypothetical protein FQA39_LY08228 [Lamprigera yunnana]
MALGDYPLEYDSKKHGPYDPARYYGKADTPLAQVKLGELSGWLNRRNKSPRAMAACVSRAWWRWQHKYVQPKRAGIAPIVQLATVCMAISYVMNYRRISGHSHYKYH